MIDEGIYLQAFDARRAGGSPYDVDGYLYPPALAEVGSWLVTAFGSTATGWILRVLNMAGLLFIAARGVAWLEASGLRPMLRHWFMIGAMLTISTGVELGMRTANLSFLAGGLLLAALACLDARPWSAGMLLASSALVKPFAVPAITVLAVAGLAARRRAWLIASGLAGGLVLALSLPSPFFRDMLTALPSPLTEARATSIRRLLKLVGYELPALALTLTLIGCLCIAAWIHCRRGVVIRMLAMLGVLAMPVVWNHSLVLLTPIVCGALALAWQRRRKSWAEPILALLGGFAVLAFESGALDLLPPAFGFVLLLPPLAAPILLMCYLVLVGRVEPPMRASPLR